MYFAIVRLVKLGSMLACMMVIVSFTLFAINQMSGASTHQQQALEGTGIAASTSPSSTPPRPSPSSHPTSVRKTIDEAAEWLTSPFAGLTSGSHSEWAIRGVGLLLALIVYGFGVGFLARALRVRI